MATNPYQPPLADAEVPAAPTANRIEFGTTIKRWERYRLIYNGSLIVLVLAVTVVTRPWSLADPSFWATMIMCALVCNVCFFLGPAAEGYLVWLGWWRKGISLFLLIAGTAVTALAAVNVLLAEPPLNG